MEGTVVRTVEGTCKGSLGSILCAEYQLRLWRVCNLLMSLFFALAAYVQINDPDAGMWIVIYLVPATLILLLSIKPDITGHVIWKTLSDLHSAVCLVGASCLFISLLVYGKKNILHEEEGRELSGLTIIVLWLLLCRNSGRGSMGGLRLLIAVSIAVFPFVTWLYIYINKEMRTSWPQHCKTVI
ncbi:PREDICTED: transmembrane protein 220 [Nanorana parkeri]|uniref:transmembrane protein 220 n=1 Tax=Nanorana parkeri TaxID=125878 RepID=UPI00085439A0|nr:PREDICTED: transmembrane protein 220 [Nanorana parkeri]